MAIDKFMGKLFKDGVLVPQQISKQLISLFYDSTVDKFLPEMKRNKSFCEALQQKNIVNSNLFNGNWSFSARELEVIMQEYGSIYLEELRQRESKLKLKKENIKEKHKKHYDKLLKTGKIVLKSGKKKRTKNKTK